jgi:Caspase domain
MTSALGGGGRVLLAAGTKTYRHGADFAQPLANLAGVESALGWVVEALAGLGYQPAPTGAGRYLLDPNLQQLRQAVRAAASSAPVVVVYYTGHGIQPERSPYYLITTGTQPGELEDEALEARQLLRLVVRRDPHGEVLDDDQQPQVLVILDCCFAGAGGIEALKDALQGMGNPKVWLLASASSLEYAQQGHFAAALRQALLDPDVGSSQPLLGLNEVTEQVNETLGQAEQRARYIPPGGESTGGPTPFFPNPRYVPGVAGLTVAEQHWVSRLRGAPADTTTTGFYVTGRTGRYQVVKDLASWMRDPDRGGLAVVTGSPGAGKSAMLALPVLLTDDQRSETLLAGAAPGSLVTRAAELFDSLPVLGVHARGRNPYQVANDIARSLGRAADSPRELLDDLDDHREPSSQIVVVDAVDEARDPQRLMTDLLVPLARRPGLRVVVGARRHLLPPAADTSLLVDLDSDNYRDPQALTDYAHQLLGATHEPDVASPYRDRDDDTAATVAEAIADKATARRGRAARVVSACPAAGPHCARPPARPRHHPRRLGRPVAYRRGRGVRRGPAPPRRPGADRPGHAGRPGLGQGAWSAVGADLGAGRPGACRSQRDRRTAAGPRRRPVAPGQRWRVRGGGRGSGSAVGVPALSRAAGRPPARPAHRRPNRH